MTLPELTDPDTPTPHPARGQRWLRPMRPRLTDERHRVATPLELLFDLCFVVAVAQASTKLHHALSEGHLATGSVAYLAVFFSVWWAWMNFTWFASAYDVDDVPYRVATFVQIVGVLILAAGVPRAFDHDFAVVTLGYAVMRCGLVAQWLRAARGSTEPPARRTAHGYALGIAVCMIGWGALLLVPGHWRAAGFAVMVVAELAVPIIAERPRRTAWHAHHIAERYGLFTIIVLGESILSATIAVQSAFDEHRAGGALFAVAAGGLLIVFALWWLYFARSAHGFLVSNRVSFVWGYGHFFVFAAAAALGAGLAANTDRVTHHGELGAYAAGAAVTVPVAVYLLALTVLQLRPQHAGPVRTGLAPAAAVAVLATTGFAAVSAALTVLATGAVLAVLIAATEALGWDPAPRPAGKA
ncbi:putative membrane protein [Frankia canadensis]|uniref:Putative membrane protein n=1 Tax=Frankia canadensis TaxID=1836972 RepID=A0A2I2KYP2_9ACTN|nr:low temperature requirement protein A [Frankia canadensis]SNQ50792.1 putative membrane protein [Frankia canadensis]SOU58082.1 putative membrane protein [Frankia canadensis]